MTKQQAVSDIITYQTLPHQIDFVRPYKIKAIIAEKFLSMLPKEEMHEAYQHIADEVKDYYEPKPSLKGYSIADLNNMF